MRKFSFYFILLAIALIVGSCNTNLFEDNIGKKRLSNAPDSTINKERYIVPLSAAMQEMSAVMNLLDEANEEDLFSKKEIGRIMAITKKSNFFSNACRK